MTSVFLKILGITTLLFAVLSYAAWHFLSGNFWDGVFSAALGQMLALIIGIPVAFYLDSERRKKEADERYLQERKEELEVLRSIEIELLYNSQIFLITRRNLSTENRHAELQIFQYQTEVWDTIRSNGQASVIRDLQTQSGIAGAYHTLRQVSFLENLAIERYSQNASDFGGRVEVFYNKKAMTLDEVLSKNLYEGVAGIIERINILKKGISHVEGGPEELEEKPPELESLKASDNPDKQGNN